MKRTVLYFIISCLIGNISFSQTSGFIDRFNDGVQTTAWGFNLAMSYQEADSVQKITANPWRYLKFSYTTPDHLTIASRPCISLKVKTDSAFVLGIYLKNIDKSSLMISQYVPSSGVFTELIYDFGGFFNGIDSTYITDIYFCPNPSDAYKGSFYIDDLAMGDSAKLPPSRCTGIVPKTDTVAVVIATDSMKLLDQYPYDTSVHGNFYDVSHNLYPFIEMQYRGAYTIMDLLYKGPYRNWKFKFPKSQKYQNNREWNYNRDLTMREKLVSDLLAAAGVVNTSPTYKRLTVNGAMHGMYIEYADPDNKTFLTKWFNDNNGDLYKSSTDLPNRPVYFGGLNFLGNHDSCYYYHYDKKTNNNNVPVDFSSLRKFLTMITFIPNDQFVDTLSRYFDVPSFLRYLVVSNYVNNWDGYPQRPKNFWVYQRSTDKKWFFIPWDHNSTFEIRYEPYKFYGMGAQSSIFYSSIMQMHINYAVEDSSKVLVERMMRYAQFRNAYVLEYKKALSTYLERESIIHRIDSLEQYLACNVSDSEYKELRSDNAEVRTFIDIKSKAVAKELSTVAIWDTLPVTNYFPPDTNPISVKPVMIGLNSVSETYPNPNAGTFSVSINSEKEEWLYSAVFDNAGTCIMERQDRITAGSNVINYRMDIEQGMYYLKLRAENFEAVRKVVVR